MKGHGWWAAGKEAGEAFPASLIPRRLPAAERWSPPGEIQFLRRVADIEADDAAFGVDIDRKAFGNLTRLGAPWRRLPLDIEAVGLRIIEQLHRAPRRHAG
jgi:hypothetical protein